MQWYRIGVNKISPTIDSLFATSLQVVGFHCTTSFEALAGKGSMARRQRMSCNDVLACLDVLSVVDTDHDVDIEDSLSWDESDPDSKEV